MGEVPRRLASGHCPKFFEPIARCWLSPLAARRCKEYVMSIEQIKREFPFLWQAFPIEEELPGHALDIRISRLSLEALDLLIGEVFEPDYHIDRRLYATDAKGKEICTQGHCISDSNMPGDTVGKLLFHAFWPDGENFANEVCYLVYTVTASRSEWRRYGHTKKAQKVMITKRFESIIFKMPKNYTLWELLLRYRRQRRAMMRR